MKRFERIIDFSIEEFNEKFPMFITDDLRISEDRRQIAAISASYQIFELQAFCDQKENDPSASSHIFCCVFNGEDADAIRNMIDEFLSAEHDSISITFMNKVEDRFEIVSYGNICREMLNDQEKLRSLLMRVMINRTLDSCDEAFLLPFRAHMFECPVCGHRTLSTRGMFYICMECGWEDEGLDADEEDIMSCGTNGDWTIRQYRERYLQKKAADPGYYWHRQFEEKG